MNAARPNQSTRSGSGSDHSAQVLRRRTLIGAAAWSAPILLSSASVPAVAASPSQPPVVTIHSLASDLTVNRCAVANAGDIRFQIHVDGLPGAVSDLVTIQLPDGLRFVGGDSVLALPCGPTGLVTVPAIQAVGSAGTYSVTATLGTETAFSSVTVHGAQAASVTLIPFGAATTSGTITTIPNVAAVDLGTEGFGFLDSDGRLFVSGEAFGTPAAEPVQVATDIARMRVGAEPQISGSKLSTKLIVMTTSNEVYVSASVSALPVLSKMTNYTGTVRDLQTYYGANYVITTAGIHYSGTAYGSTHLSPLALLPGSAETTVYDLWSGSAPDKRVMGGGALVDANGSVVTFSSTEAAPVRRTVQSRPSAAIRTIGASKNTVMALDVNGRLWGYGGAFGDTFTEIFAQPGISFAAMSHWARIDLGNDYFGATLLGTDGAVYQTYDATRIEKVKGLDDVVVTRMFANDGIYQVLASDGSVWSWLGNNNWIDGVGVATVVPGLASIGDFAAHSRRNTAKPETSPQSYSGWGLALDQDACTLI